MKKKLSVVVLMLIMAVAMMAMSACSNGAKVEHSHAYGEWKTTVIATCSSVGARERVCSGCTVKDTEAIEKLAHTLGEFVIDKAATCTAVGSKSKVCSGCNEKFEVTVTEKLAHTPDADDKDCTTAAKCTVCKEVTTAAKTHVEAANWSKNDTQHWKECDNDGCDVIVGDKTNHIDKNGSNVCECGAVNIAIFTIGDGVLTKFTKGEYTNITIPEGVTSIGENVFQDCTSLTSITMPSTVTSIGKMAFNGCTKLTSLTIPEGVTSIGASAFNSCESLTSITIPSKVTEMGGYAFYGCTSLTSITIPEGVTSIGDSAFRECTSLTSITLPSSVTSIGAEAFVACSGLETMTVATGNTKYSSNGNCIIEKATGTLIAGCKNSVIPTDGSVTIIGGSAFKDCTDLTTITIPSSVTSIGTEAFFRCTSLTSVTIAEDSKLTIIGSQAFSGCESLTAITIPSSVTVIEYNAFSGCENLTITVGVSAKPAGWDRNWSTGAKEVIWAKA